MNMDDAGRYMQYTEYVYIPPPNDMSRKMRSEDQLLADTFIVNVLLSSVQWLPPIPLPISCSRG